MTASSNATAVTHRSVLAIAVPIMLSNVTEPLIGVVDTAIIGRLPEPYYIGAISVGALIFSFIYWGFGFLRMGTGGLSAQAKGAGDGRELDAVLIRALIIAGACGLALVLLSPLIGRLAFTLLEGSKDVEFHAWQYFTIRVWSAPFALANYCLLGWFIGQGKARTAFVIQIYLNAATSRSMPVRAGLGMTSDGVAYGTLIAEVTAALLGLAIASGRDPPVRWRAGVRPRQALAHARGQPRHHDPHALPGVRFLLVHRAGRQGRRHSPRGQCRAPAFLRCGGVLDRWLRLRVGSAGRPSRRGQGPAPFRAALSITWIWIMAAGALCAALIFFAGPLFIDAMTVNAEIRAVARQFLWWAALTPLIGAIPFQFDGIYSGATQTADMRNMMIVSLAGYLALWWLLLPFGNHGLWAALCIFFALRGITFAVRMPALRRAAFR